MIALKTPAEIAIMRENGRILAQILDKLCEKVRPGRTTQFFDNLAEMLIREAGAVPSFKGYSGYPASINASINEEVVHGIPSLERWLEEGDVFSIDIGLLRNGMHVDMATTVAVGNVDDIARQMMDVGERSLWEGIEQVKIGNRLSDISHAIGSCVEAAGFHVVKEYVGHGIGKALHEDPQIPNYGPPGHGMRLRPGMALAIEPMIKIDSLPTQVQADRWTVVTGSGGLSVHFEHTIVLTDDRAVVVTLGGDEKA
ncbi:type I methionyl aminopeptidase [Candidatus Bipolaricaulota bacterium]|nr:type I methionyl aminopeptidase [Candidatus Bipolaricaulota bacterium]TFH11701.1 MAG: type I methionyl aminopeptidase [Candidatus Atribacteria bacterium]